MDCTEVKPRLEGCVAGTIPADERAAVDAHLAKCEGCRLELELTRAVLGAPPSAIPKGVSEAPPLTLELDSLAPRMPEPGAIDLPSLTGEPSGEVRGAPPQGGPILESRAPASDAEVSFADVTSESPLPPPPPGGREATHADAFPEPDAGPSSAEPPSSGGQWGFEPAEPREAAPPEGSLFFAEEALAKTERHKGDRRSAKLHLARLAFWCGGASLGLGLLAASVWMALASHDEDPRSAADRAANRRPTSGQAPAATQVGASPVPATAVPAQPEAIPPPAPTPPAQLAPTAVTPAAPPPGTSSAHQPSPPLAAQSSPRSPQPPPTAFSSPRVTKIVPKPVLEPMDDDFDMEPDPAPADEPELVHVPITKHAGGGSRRTEAPSLSPPVAKPEATAPVEPAKPETPPVSRPIDRLHLATEQAGASADLAALRKLKSTWKAFLQTATGPDRARAKREYADCLWEIQELTGRNSDRREALAAYREYVLNAPAGGVDARTVGRMRTLEDVLSESK